MNNFYFKFPAKKMFRPKLSFCFALLFLVGLSTSNFYRSQRPRPQQRPRWPQQRRLTSSYDSRQSYRTYPPHPNLSPGRSQLRQRDTEDQGEFVTQRGLKLCFHWSVLRNKLMRFREAKNTSYLIEQAKVLHKML